MPVVARLDHPAGIPDCGEPAPGEADGAADSLVSAGTAPAPLPDRRPVDGPETAGADGVVTDGIRVHGPNTGAETSGP